MITEPRARWRTARLAVGVALEVPAVLLALRGGVAGLFGLALALTALWGARWGGQIAAPLWAQLPIQGALSAGLVGALSLLGDVPRGQLGAYVTVGFLAAALPRLWVKVDPAGRTITLSLGLLALTGMARAVPRPAFGAAVAVFLAAGIVATLAADRSAPSVLRHPRGALLPLLAALGLAGVFMLALGWTLPAAEPAVSKALQSYLFDKPVAESGFGEGRVSLGDLRSIVTSDAVTLRVFGDADHLRGKVYVDYAHGRWESRRRPKDRPPRGDGPQVALGGGSPTGAPVRIEAEHDAGSPLFAPLGAARLLDVPEDARLDAYGVATFPAQRLADARRWRFEPGAVDARWVAAPDDHDLDVPRTIRGSLQALGAAWTEGAATPAARVEALARRLRVDFAYSLELDEAPGHVDPTWYFLSVAQRGHCEYFASALALLARSQGVPARMVTGYRVFEYNGAGGYHIVRRRDAHAWVEVFIDGAWRTVDPTPAGVLAGESVRTAGWWRARWDVLARAASAAFERLAGLSRLELLSAVGLMSLLALAWLGIRRRRPAAPPPEQFAPLGRLEARLAAARAPVRRRSEPLLRYADRLAAGGWGSAGALVVACARYLYGGEGSVDALAAAVQAWRPPAGDTPSPAGADAEGQGAGGPGSSEGGSAR